MNNFDCLTTIDGEILKGIKIRENKIKIRPISNYVTDIDFDQPSCSNASRWHDPVRRHERELSTGFGFTGNYKSTVHRKHNTRDHTGVRKTKKKILSKQTKTRCPMRIMQLSVPTKRYCLETWRSNRDVLPDFMVERLRRIVMDEKTIVKIYDAISCFKRQKSTKSRLNSKRKINAKHRDQIKLFCGILSYKVIQKLQRPLNITLDSQLKTLSEVINEDITSILYNPKKSEFNENIRIQTEVADAASRQKYSEKFIIAHR
ncbi:uncharacterized protein LOC124541130 [Vanessa cardui]|uniref:uncharacterized protein LOC124541130 n=1 Tax=Vanessa cardui TaxID=171605 RepID=UPI001F132C0A|nr:uncharacterized protein LOC124541130 [Vanessa cardui]